LKTICFLKSLLSKIEELWACLSAESSQPGGEQISGRPVGIVIPESKYGAVARALSETFGVSGYGDIRILTAGMSSARVESETEGLLQAYARVASVYPRHDSDMVSSYNDLKPENILFDGDRVWLVDWGAAFLNDWYHDLAAVANFVVTNDAEEEAYLRTYFGEAAGEYRLARFYLMRQILPMGYAKVFMLLGSGGKAIEPNAKAPAFRDFHNRIWAGEVSLVIDEEAKLQYARVHEPDFAEYADRTISERTTDGLRSACERIAVGARGWPAAIRSVSLGGSGLPGGEQAGLPHRRRPLRR
jgi:hypothetical protein